jgi:hypothetical protein
MYGVRMQLARQVCRREREKTNDEKSSGIHAAAADDDDKGGCLTGITLSAFSS